LFHQSQWHPSLYFSLYQTRFAVELLDLMIARYHSLFHHLFYLIQSGHMVFNERSDVAVISFQNTGTTLLLFANRLCCDGNTSTGFTCHCIQVHLVQLVATEDKNMLKVKTADVPSVQVPGTNRLSGVRSAAAKISTCRRRTHRNDRCFLICPVAQSCIEVNTNTC